MREMDKAAQASLDLGFFISTSLKQAQFVEIKKPVSLHETGFII